MDKSPVLNSYLKIMKKQGSNCVERSKKSFERATVRDFHNSQSYYDCVVEKPDHSTDITGVRMINMSTTMDKKNIYFRPNYPIENGDLVTITNKANKEETYLAVKVEYNELFPNIKQALLCNQTLMYKGLKKPIPVWSDNSSYGVKGEIDTTYLSQVDGKIQLFMANSKEAKAIEMGWRFVFDKDKNQVYKVVDPNTVTTGQARRIVIQKVESIGKDDIENNIGYIRDLEETVIDKEEEKPSTEPYNVASTTKNFEVKRYGSNEFYLVDNLTGEVDKDNWNIKIDFKDIDTTSIKVDFTKTNTVKIKNLTNTKGNITIIFSKEDLVVVQEVKLTR